MFTASNRDDALKQCEFLLHRTVLCESRAFVTTASKIGKREGCHAMRVVSGWRLSHVLISECPPLCFGGISAMW